MCPKSCPADYTAPSSDTLRRQRDPGATLLAADEITFLICVEANQLEAQARLLCTSIRKFAGRYAQAAIVAVSPRPDLSLSAQSQAQLKALGVRYVSAPLNETGHAYGTINRIVAGAWAEEHLTSPYLVVLDTDMLFVDEPVLVRCDVGVRPVDAKGAATSGPDDPLDAYWQSLCDHAGVALSALLMIQTSTSKETIRASYNGGFLVVRRSLGILRKTQDIFFASLEAGMAPLAGRGFNVKASTGSVGVQASEWWGSSQAALSVAIWSMTSDVRLYDDRYNIPLHILVDPAQPWSSSPILLHYHYLLEAEHRPDLIAVARRLGCSGETCDWIFDCLCDLP